MSLNAHVYEFVTLIYANFVFPFASAFSSYFGKHKFGVEQFMVVRPGIGPDKSHCLDKWVQKRNA
jgi:hypothetical protein